MATAGPPKSSLIMCHLSIRVIMQIQLTFFFFFLKIVLKGIKVT
jgi:hypothetical protein